MNEADTCRIWVTPMRQAAGWDQDPHRISEQVTFTDGRIVVVGQQGRRREGKRADYLLRYRPDFFHAVVEAKPDTEPAGAGLQQAKEYALILGLQFAYSTNGKEIVEFDFLTGKERCLKAYPTSARERGYHAPAARAAGRKHSQERAADCGVDGRDQVPAGEEGMNKASTRSLTRRRGDAEKRG